MNGFDIQRIQARTQQIMEHVLARRLDEGTIDTVTNELARGIAILEYELDRSGIATRPTRGCWTEQSASALRGTRLEAQILARRLLCEHRWVGPATGATHCERCGERSPSLEFLRGASPVQSGGEG